MELQYKPSRFRFLTRDSYADGSLHLCVDVWDEPPVRVLQADGSYEWLAGIEDDEDPCSLRGHQHQLDLMKCRDKYGTVPDTDRQLIRIGRVLPN